MPCQVRSLRIAGPFAVVFAMLVVASHSTGQEKQAEEKADVKQEEKTGKVETAKLGATRNVHVCNGLFLAGQFQEDDFDVFSENKIKRIITLRVSNEIKWDEKKVAEEKGFEFIEIPFRGEESLTDEVFDKVRKLLKEKDKTTLLHCGSANRVGGVWLPYRVLDQGVDLETALKEAREVGLRTKAYEKKAIEYIKRKMKK